MLEEMGEYFDSRLDGYDMHQLTAIEGAREFYPFTASCLPAEPGASLLDLGCGTGLELEYYFALNPTARITGIDLAPGMLMALRAKFKEKDLTLICGSYFDTAFENETYDAVLSVESLHHYTVGEKIKLYARLQNALKPNGFFILTDYFALSNAEEASRRQELNRMKKELAVREDALYHYDTPLTVAHETEALLAAGFSSVRVLRQWSSTCTLKAEK